MVVRVPLPFLIIFVVLPETMTKFYCRQRKKPPGHMHVLVPLASRVDSPHFVPGGLPACGTQALGR